MEEKTLIKETAIEEVLQKVKEGLARLDFYFADIKVFINERERLVFEYKAHSFEIPYEAKAYEYIRVRLEDDFDMEEMKGNFLIAFKDGSKFAIQMLSLIEFEFRFRKEKEIGNYSTPQAVINELEKCVKKLNGDYRLLDIPDSEDCDKRYLEQYDLFFDGNELVCQDENTGYTNRDVKEIFCLEDEQKEIHILFKDGSDLWFQKEFEGEHVFFNFVDQSGNEKFMFEIEVPSFFKNRL